MPDWVSCPALDCLAQKGVIKLGCTRCLEHGYVEADPNAGEPPAVYLHEWRAFGHKTEEALIEEVEMLWICLKCGDTSLLDRPPLGGCDVKVMPDGTLDDELAKSPLEEAVDMIIEAGGANGLA